MGAMVTCRPCVYERRVWNGGSEVWELADRRAFSEGRRRARGHVRRRLGEAIEAGATMCGVRGKTWASIVKTHMAPVKPEDGQIALGEVEEHNDTVALVFGLRCGDMPGVLHDKMHRRMKRQEEETRGGRRDLRDARVVSLNPIPRPTPRDDRGRI